MTCVEIRSLASRLWALVMTAIVLVCAPPTQLLAQTKTITFDVAGPSSPLELTKEFYLEGVAAADAEYVHLVYVRHSFGAWGINGFGITHCGEVAKALANPRPDALKQTTNGRLDIDELWTRPDPAKAEDKAKTETEKAACDYDTLNNRHSALVVGPWVKADADKPQGDQKQKWKILTPASDFFSVGAEYCLFVYNTKHTADVQPVMA